MAKHIIDMSNVIEYLLAGRVGMCIVESIP